MKNLSTYILVSTFILASCGGGGGGGGGGSTPMPPSTPTPTTYTFDARNFIQNSQLQVKGHYYVRDSTNSYDCINTFEATLVRSSNTEIYFQNFNLVESRTRAFGDNGIEVSVDYESYNGSVNLVDASQVSSSNNLTFYPYSGTTPLSDIPYQDRSANLSLKFSAEDFADDSCLIDMNLSLLAAGSSPTHTLYGSDGNSMFLVMFPKDNVDAYAGDAVKEADIFHDGFPGWAGFQSYHAYGSKPTISFNGESSTLDEAFDAYNNDNGYAQWSSDDINYYGSPIYDVTYRNLNDGSFSSTGFSKFLSINGGVQNVFLIGKESTTNQYSDAYTYLYLFMYGDKKRLIGFKPDDFSAWFFVKAE